MTALSHRARMVATAAALVGVGLVTGVVVSQLGVAGAAAPTPKPSDQAQAREHRLPAPPFGMFGGPGFAFGGRVLHGEATVDTGDGTKVLANQSGEIASIDGDTITVKSSDDFTRDYTIDKDTRIVLDGTDGALSSLETGDTVHVTAQKDGAAYHAQLVVDGAPDRPMFGWRMHGHMPMPPMPAMPPRSG